MTNPTEDRGKSKKSITISSPPMGDFYESNRRLPYYKIESRDGNATRNVGYVTLRVTEGRDKPIYQVIKHLPDGDSEEEITTDRKEMELHDAIALTTSRAYEAARKLANKKSIPLENKVGEDLEHSDFEIPTNIHGRRSPLAPSFAALIAGVALGVSSLNPTGNVISGVVGGMGSLLGAILFVAGILGIMYHASRK